MIHSTVIPAMVIAGRNAAMNGNPGGKVDDIEQLLDTERIRRLTSLYSHHFDRLDLDGLVGLFTDDAVCEFSRGKPIVGKDAIRTHYTASFAKWGKGGPFSTMHAVTNHWIELTGPDCAEGRCYLIDFAISDPKTNPLVFLGIYDDEYRKLAGEWKIRQRRLEFAWPPRSTTAGAPGQRLPWVDERS